MLARERLNSLLNREVSSKDNDELCRTLTMFAKEFGYTPETLFGFEEEHHYKWWIFKWKKVIKRMGIPVPTFSVMLDEWNKEQKKQEREMKSKTPRGRRR